MKMSHKHRSSGHLQLNGNRKDGARSLGVYFNFKGIYIFTVMLLIMMIVSQCFNYNVAAKNLQRSKKTLKLLQSSSSLIQLRHKRDTFANENQQHQRQQQGEQPFVRDNIHYYENVDAKDDDDDDYDNNYDVLPEMFGGTSQPPTLGDQISEKAKQVAQSFSNMWQSLTETIRHCIDALRGLFGDDVGQEENLTPEQEQQLSVARDQQYRAKHESDNEVLMNVHENKL